MGKQIRFDAAARAALRRGLDRLADAVKVTLGPSGRNVALERRDSAPTLTRDGVTIAREIDLPDPVENLGAHLAREVSGKTQEMVGDGTTTATVLAQSLVAQGLEAVERGCNPVALKRGLDHGTSGVIAELRRLSRPLAASRDVARVASLSAGGDSAVGALVARALERVGGAAGIVTVTEGHGRQSRLEVSEGLRFGSGYLSAYFINDADNMRVELRDCRVLLVDGTIASAAEVAPALELAAGSGWPLLVVAEEIEVEALSTLVANQLRGELHVCAVKTPGFGERQREMLEDLALITGGTVFSPRSGRHLAGLTAEDLGRARTASVERDTSTVVGPEGASERREGMVARLEAQLREATRGPQRERLAERLARLRGAVGVIEVGGAGEQEIAERKVRIEDALAAARAALEEGVIPGGGVGLLRASGILPGLGLRGDEERGASILAQALEIPARMIAENAGFDGAEVVERIRALSGWNGFNALSGNYEDLERAGIVDPVRVTRVALQNAESISGLILTTDCLITGNND